MQSDLMQPDFLAAAHGHNMNGCGVLTSVCSLIALSVAILTNRQSIRADIAYTLVDYLYGKLVPGTKQVDVNVANLEVVRGLVAQNNTNMARLIQVSAETADMNPGLVHLACQNVDMNGTVHELFATANIIYGDAQQWLASWTPMTHLIEGRIEILERLAQNGIASRYSHSMAHTLSANLVDYADKYRGMRAVVLYEFEAFTDITLSKEKGGTWTIPPYFIDSVAHLAGFIMNISDASNTAKTFCATPGWRSIRFAKPLTAGQQYRSYVKVIPIATKHLATGWQP